MQKYQNNIAARNGDAVVGIKVLIKLAGTATPATIYSDDGVTTTPNPLTTNANGYFEFYVANGLYDIAVSGVNTYTDVLIADALGIDADALKKTEAAAPSGATLVGTDDGDTVQDALDGRPTIVALAADDGAAGVGYIAAGADAVRWTAEDKLDEQPYTVTNVMNVFERADVLGKVGALDVSAAFAKAFAISTSLLIPEGRYFAPTIEYPNNAKVQGAGKGRTVLVGLALAIGSIIGTASVAARDITFDTWDVPLLVTQSTLYGLDVNGCEFVGCKKSVSDRTGSTNTIDATKTVRNFNYLGNTDRDGEKGVSLSCLVQVANVRFNVVRNLNHATRAVAYQLGGEDGTDTVFNSFSVCIEDNDIEGIYTTGLNAETHGVMLYAKNSSASKNRVHNVKNSNPSTVNGVEGIYAKGPGSFVDENDMLDAGLGQGSIALKNKNGSNISARRNRIVYLTVPLMTAPDFLTGIYASELAGATAIITDNIILGAQRPVAVPTEPGARPEYVGIKRNYAEGDFYAGYFVAAAKILEVEDNFSRQTNPSLSSTSIGVFCLANATVTDVLSIKNNKSSGVYRSVVVTYSGTASINLLRVEGNDCGVNSAITGNRGLSYSGTIAALILKNNDFTTPTTKVVGTPPASFSADGNLGYKTNNRGTATIAAGSTSNAAILHGLGLAPRVQDVRLSFDGPGWLGATTKLEVTATSANYITVTADIAPGGTGAKFNWEARAYEA